MSFAETKRKCRCRHAAKGLYGRGDRRRAFIWSNPDCHRDPGRLLTWLSTHDSWRKRRTKAWISRHLFSIFRTTSVRLDGVWCRKSPDSDWPRGSSPFACRGDWKSRSCNLYQLWPRLRSEPRRLRGDVERLSSKQWPNISPSFLSSSDVEADAALKFLSSKRNALCVALSFGSLSVFVVRHGKEPFLHQLWRLHCRRAACNDCHRSVWERAVFCTNCHHGSWLSRGDCGISSNVDVCEKAKHHTELFW